MIGVNRPYFLGSSTGKKSEAENNADDSKARQSAEDGLGGYFQKDTVRRFVPYMTTMFPLAGAMGTAGYIAVNEAVSSVTGEEFDRVTDNALTNVAIHTGASAVAGAAVSGTVASLGLAIGFLVYAGRRGLKHLAQRLR